MLARYGTRGLNSLDSSSTKSDPSGSGFRRANVYRNALAFVVPQALWGVAWSLTWDGPMPAALVAAMGGDSSLVGTAQLLTGLGLGVGMFLSGFVLAPLRSKRVVVYLGHSFVALMLFVMALALSGLRNDLLPVLRAAYLVVTFVYFLGLGLFIPIWLSLVSDLFHPAHRARILAIAFMANRVGGILGGMWSESTLAATTVTLDAWTWLFGIAGVAGLLGSVPFLALIERARTPNHRPRMGKHIGSLIDVFRHGHALRRFVLADLLAVASFVIIAYFGDAAIRRDGLDPSWSGRWVQYAAIGQLVICGLIATVGARVPMRRWLTASLVLMAVAAFACAAGGGPSGYSFAAACGGVFMGIRLSCHSPEVMRLQRDEDPTLALSAVGASITPVQGAFPFVAGLALAAVSYQAVFVAVAAILIIAALLLWRWVPNPSTLATEPIPEHP